MLMPLIVVLCVDISAGEEEGVGYNRKVIRIYVNAEYKGRQCDLSEDRWTLTSTASSYPRADIFPLNKVSECWEILYMSDIPLPNFGQPTQK